MKKILACIKGYYKELILGPFFKLIEAIFELMVPMITARMIDKGIASQDTPYIIRMGCVLVAFALFGLISALICQYYASKCAYGFGTSLRRELYHHVHQLSQSTLDRLGGATLITRITSDTNTAQSGLNMFIRLGTRCPYLIIGSAIMALRIDRKLSIIFLIAIPVIGTILYTVTKLTVPRFQANQSKLDNIARHTRENLDGVRVIRAANKEAQEIETYDFDCTAYAKSSVSVGKISALLNPASFVIMNLSIAAVLWFGGYRVYDGHLTQGQLTALISYLTQISLTMVRLSELLVIFSKAGACAKRLGDILEEPIDMQNGTQALPTESDAPLLSFDHVSFQYPSGGEDSLQDISFDLKSGETLGIIGGTGSGKSTIVSLLSRFYDPTQGEIRYYGIPLQSCNMQEVRSICGMVPQKTTLLTGTIADNLRWSNPTATQAEIETALHMAQADFVFTLPDQTETMLTQGGKNLSGGQKQRLTIARALVRHPKLLVLDDSTSALDYVTEAALRKELAALDMTKIIISQRVTSLLHADKILVLEDGACVGFGTHEQLLASCPIYTEIYHTQMA